MKKLFFLAILAACSSVQAKIWTTEYAGSLERFGLFAGQPGEVLPWHPVLTFETASDADGEYISSFGTAGGILSIQYQADGVPTGSSVSPSDFTLRSKAAVAAGELSSFSIEFGFASIGSDGTRWTWTDRSVTVVRTDRSYDLGISYSGTATAVPEPTSAALLGIGAAALFARRSLLRSNRPVAPKR